MPATPPRVPGSARRTTSIDVSRPDGLAGPAVVDVRGQDVRTAGDGDARVVECLAVTLEVDQQTGAITDVTVDQAPGPVDGLVGLNARSGYGRALAPCSPWTPGGVRCSTAPWTTWEAPSSCPGTACCAPGTSWSTRTGVRPGALAQADVCTGWASGGPLLETLRTTGRSAVPSGPAAPVIEGDDPSGWHPMAPLATGAVRRRRRLDVIPAPGSGGEALVTQSHFRDSYEADDGEMVMHEYVVDAAVDGERRLARVTVQPRVLPWRECPGAVASAQRLVGVAVDDIPARVRRDLMGTTTCTHLNSTLRCLADVDALAG